MCSVRKEPYPADVRQQAKEYFERGLGYKAVAKILELPASITRDWGRAYKSGVFRTELAMTYEKSLLISMKMAGVDCVSRRNKAILIEAYRRVRPVVVSDDTAVQAMMIAARQSKRFERTTIEGLVAYRLCDPSILHE
ncbi:MAG: hypothetical protein Q4E62_08185 [Sutterellaceae bacterium]|nr:hypothetical protein [Sutterellaceae bacterium]